MGNGSTKETTTPKETPVEDWAMVKNPSNVKMIQNEQNVIETEEEKSVFNLTVLQKQLICDTWANIEEKAIFGQMVLKRIFVMSPQTKDLYQMQTINEEQFLQSLKFTTKADHITTFMGLAIGYLVRNENAIVKLAKVFGQEHIKPRLDTNADSQYWQIFKDAVLEEIESDQKTIGAEYSETKMSKNIKEAWNIMMTEIVGTAKSSYNEARRKLNSKKQVNVAHIVRKSQGQT